MTNQQKIEFYLSKGFAVEVEFEDDRIAKLFFINNGVYCGNIGKINTCWNPQDLCCMGWSEAIVTPIPPKPYEFKCGERVMIIESGNIYTISGINEDGSYALPGCESHQFYELAPALPEDEECEVVEVKSLDAFEFNAKGIVTFTKPDGKKLKIKVIKK